MEIIDTAGQEEYRTLRDIYFKEADGFLIVYSIISRASFVDVQKIKRDLSKLHGESKAVILIGNKCDMVDEREIKEDEAYSFAVSNQIGFYETSAKTMHNVNEAFKGLVRLVDKFRKTNPTDTPIENKEDSHEEDNKINNNDKKPKETTNTKTKTKKGGCTLL